MTGGYAGKILRIDLTAKAISTSMDGKPVCENVKWSWQPLSDMYLDDAGVGLFKTSFFKLEGWDAKNGWPARKTLEDLSLKKWRIH